MTNAPSLEVSSVYPKKNSLSFVSSLRFGPDVECQAVLALLVARLVDLSKQAGRVGTRRSNRICRTGWQIGRAVPANCELVTVPRNPKPRSSVNATYGD